MLENMILQIDINSKCWYENSASGVLLSYMSPSYEASIFSYVFHKVFSIGQQNIYIISIAIFIKILT